MSCWGRLCYKCGQDGCWLTCCPPCISQNISPGKFFSVLPLWPLLAVTVSIVAGSFTLNGLDMVTTTVGITVDPLIINLTQASGGIIIILNLIFAYSVCSNKLRIHNIHCMAEGCRGYRIKDAENCCSAMLRLVCKMYNLIMVSLSWFTVVLAIIICVVLACLSGATLSLVTLCQISVPAIQSLLDELERLGDTLESTTLSGYVSITNGTQATEVCDAQWEMTRGSIYMLSCGGFIILAQVVMAVSYHVVAEVSWRHMKDERKKNSDERSMVSGKSEKYNSSATESYGSEPYGSEPNFGHTPPPNNLFSAPPPPNWRQDSSHGMMGLHSENI